MFGLYYFARVFLAVLHLLVRYRVARLEKRYVRLAAEADTLLKTSFTRGGTNRLDPYSTAKTQYTLARLALRRDRVEERYTSWQTFSERFGSFRRAVAGYRGRLVPYFFGLVDVSTVVVLLNQYAVDVNQVKSMIGL